MSSLDMARCNGTHTQIFSKVGNHLTMPEVYPHVLQERVPFSVSNIVPSARPPPNFYSMTPSIAFSSFRSFECAVLSERFFSLREHVFTRSPY